MHGGDVWQGGAPGDWLDFSANLRPEGPPAWVKEALTRGLCEAAYYPDLHMRAARAGLADYLEVDPECVLPTAGGIAAIDLVNSLAWEEVLVPAPGFGEYELTARQRGRAVRRIALDPRSSPAGELRGRIAPNCLVWLGNPQNPTGRASAPEDVAALLRALSAVDGFLAVDEAFIDYCPEYTVRRWIPARANLIVVGSLTKVLGIPGVRLGYVCAAPETLERLRERLLPWALNCFAASVARALPAHREEIAADARRGRQRREALAEALTELGLDVLPSDAPFLLVDCGRPAASLAVRLKKQGILVRECQDFAGLEDGRYLRLAVRDEAANARLIEALQEALTCAESH